MRRSQLFTTTMSGSHSQLTRMVFPLTQLSASSSKFSVFILKIKTLKLVSVLACPIPVKSPYRLLGTYRSKVRRIHQWNGTFSGMGQARIKNNLFIYYLFIYYYQWERGVQPLRLEPWTSRVRGRHINHCANYSIYSSLWLHETVFHERCHYKWLINESSNNRPNFDEDSHLLLQFPWLHLSISILKKEIGCYDRWASLASPVHK